MIKFGSLRIDPAAYGSQGNAVLGIRDSGKTYTATYLAERLFENGVPFITFDPTGVWRFIRVPGAGKGYPVVVAGGEGADLPLTEAGAPKIVEAAMQSGVSLVLNLFDEKLSKASWRRIVKDCINVLIHKNHKHGLRHIFLEEAAEFVPQKVLDGDVYAVIEKLARMGGNFRLGYTLINQRSQEVNKAVLELCENLFLHRQRGKNALENLKKWLEVASDHDAEKIMKSISALDTGKCWAWMGGTDPKLITVPVKNSFHPDRRVMHGASAATVAKAVDVGSFVAGMQKALPALEAEAAANDVPKLRKRIAELEKQLSAKPSEKVAKPDHNAEVRLRSEGYNSGYGAGWKDGFDRGWYDGWAGAVERTAELLPRTPPKAKRPTPPSQDSTAAAAPPRRDLPVFAIKPKPQVLAAPAEGVTRPQQKVLDALAWWSAAGHDQPTREQVAGVAGYSPTSGGFNNLIGQINTAGWAIIPAPGQIALTDAGREIARCDDAPTTEELQARVHGVLSNPQWKLLAALIEAHPNAMTREELGEVTGYSPSSGGFNNLIGSLSTLRMVEKPMPGSVRAAAWLFLS